jgi:hypothetical protein
MSADVEAGGGLSSNARSILKYLFAHPRAKDTREGIAMWWLKQQQIEDAVHAVFRALDELVGRDLVVEERGPDLRPYYGINSRRLDEVAQVIKRPER